MRSITLKPFSKSLFQTNKQEPTYGNSANFYDRLSDDQEARNTMDPDKKERWSIVMIRLLLLFILFSSSSLPALAEGGAGGAAAGSTKSTNPNDATQTGAFDVREDYRRANKLSIPFGPPTQRNPEGLDEVKDRESQGPSTVDHGPGPVYAWPVVIPSATSKVPTKRDTGITKHRLQTFGMPISDTQFQMIHRMDQQIMLEEMFDPERVMWLGASIGTSQIQDASNSCANVARNQGAAAIDYIGSSIFNFTVDDGNKWNKIRNQLFMPMALLLLLPGAVLAQVKVVVNAGMPLGQDMNPFDGITRSIVAIFLIPATYLVVNYGIDINNSITYTIAAEYERIFHSNMYKDALCTVIRAFPVRQAHENRNGIYKPVKKWENQGDSPAAGFESRSLLIKMEDPCVGKFETDPDRADEQAPFLSVGQRFVTNSSNALLLSTWNILCAFQVVFLCYLWLIGPVIAALWVYPMAQLRSALGGWVEGVITLCFWALFWNTTVLLYACFRGVDSTGSFITSALDFLAIQCVKSAFDFAGLVKEAGAKAAGVAGGLAGNTAGGVKPNAAGDPKGSHGHGSPSAPPVGTASHAAAIGAETGTGLGTFSAAAGQPVNFDSLSKGTLSEGMIGTIANASGIAEGAAAGIAGAAGLLGGPDGGGALPPGMLGVGIGGMDIKLDGGISSLVSASSIPMTGLNSGPGGVDFNYNSLNSTLNAVTAGDMSSIFNASSLAGDINLSTGTFSARDAAGLIGQGNLANIPPPGSIVDKETAYQNFNTANAAVSALNAKDPANAGARDDLMAGWKDRLDLGEGQTSPDGTMMAIPDDVASTAAGGAYNVDGASIAGAAGFTQQFADNFQRVQASLDQASIAFNGRMPVNAEAVQGLSSLAREMTQVGPVLGGMQPQSIAATMDNWNQRAEVFTAQLSQTSGAPMSQESMARTAVDLQQAQYAMQSFQQSYPEATVSTSNAGYGGVYQGGDSQTVYGGGGPVYYSNAPQGDAGSYGAVYPSGGGGGGVYYSNAPQGDPGSYGNYQGGGGGGGPVYYSNNAPQGGDPGYGPAVNSVYYADGGQNQQQGYQQQGYSQQDYSQQGYPQQGQAQDAYNYNQGYARQDQGQGNYNNTYYDQGQSQGAAYQVPYPNAVAGSYQDTVNQQYLYNAQQGNQAGSEHYGQMAGSGGYTQAAYNEHQQNALHQNQQRHDQPQQHDQQQHDLFMQQQQYEQQQHDQHGGITHSDGSYYSSSAYRPGSQQSSTNHASGSDYYKNNTSPAGGSTPKPASQSPQSQSPQGNQRKANPLNFLKKPDAKKKAPPKPDEPPPPARE